MANEDGSHENGLSLDILHESILTLNRADNLNSFWDDFCQCACQLAPIAKIELIRNTYENIGERKILFKNGKCAKREWTKCDKGKVLKEESGKRNILVVEFSDDMNKVQLLQYHLEKIANYEEEKVESSLILLSIHARTKYELLLAGKRADELARFPFENPSPVMRVGFDHLVKYYNMAAEQFVSLDKGKWEVIPILLQLVKKSIEEENRISEQVYIDERPWKITLNPIFEHRYVSIYFEDRDIIVKAEKQREDDHHKMQYNSQMTLLGEMAGGIAHEINNPLTVIQGNLSVLKRRNINLSREEIEKRCDRGLETVRRIQVIIQGLRIFSRDGSDDEFKLVSVGKIINEAVGFCRERLRNKGIYLDLKNTDSDLHILCREIQVSQVLVNLINNSRNAISELKERWVRIEVVKDSSSVKIIFSDSGFGIPRENRHKIFEPFFTTRDIGEGTGLGLSISKGIMREHKGDIMIDEKAAHTTFIIKFPKFELEESA